jgi:hypothetical protein
MKTDWYDIQAEEARINDYIHPDAEIFPKKWLSTK